MFDKQQSEQDLMFRSILNSGQEEVPAHVWDGISSGLDRLAHRKKVALWWRRASIGIASAAAAIAVFLLINTSQTKSSDLIIGQQMEVDEQNEEIMVIENTQQSTQDTYLAYTPKIDTAPESVKRTPTTLILETETAEEKETIVTTETGPAPGKDHANRPSVKEVQIQKEDFEEKVKYEKEKKGISLTVSGITGANGGSKQFKPGILKKPSIMGTTPRTGIVESGDSDNFGPPVSVGLGVRIDLAKRWAIGTGVNYTMLYRKFNGTYTRVENGAIVEKTSSDIRNLQHYVGIPVNVYYNIIDREKINFYAYGGGAVEKCVANKYKIIKSSSVYKETVQGVQWSANIGVGVEFMVGKHLGIYIDPSAKYYFPGKQPKSIRTSQPFMLGCELGLRTRF